MRNSIPHGWWFLLYLPAKDAPIESIKLFAKSAYRIDIERYWQTVYDQITMNMPHILPGSSGRFHPARIRHTAPPCSDKARISLWQIKRNNVSIASSKSQGTHRVPYRTWWVPLFYHLPNRPFSACDLYINHFTIYIFIENDLYTNRKRSIYLS